jgi:hypothetical protein
VEQKCIKEMWGPILVDKWPGRKPQDGHTVMEKAREWKTKANLEGMNGNSKSHTLFFVRSSTEFQILLLKAALV